MPLNRKLHVVFRQRSPARMLLRLCLLEPSDGQARGPVSVFALPEVAVGDALEVEDRDRYFESLRPACVRRQNRRPKPDTLGTFANGIAHAGVAHSGRTDVGQVLADHPLRPSPVSLSACRLSKTAAWPRPHGSRQHNSATGQRRVHQRSARDFGSSPSLLATA
jgi:hypothetical protein